MNSQHIHQCNVRVYSEDVDYMGIVYHANYLRYFERARTELLRQKQLLLSDLKQLEVLFAISEVNMRYIKPALLDDLLTIETEIIERKACSFIFKQSMLNQQGKLLCDANIKAVCVDGRLKPRRLPDIIG
ncbi:YbgC/FadM family acyl-CoA thioesterase [Legionella shakespearei]|uniref:Esterase n=1 Tax=Legionella shakespearei DSM 23087 TaxID=1122169 RepID=A0A0W0Z0W4_9GAMM|nr:YbgC/FadM family acyl-CoA thioesterase [Legionella shakespearei]KTD62764.1 esterase [Legionella shakespearei DSM 23087]